MTDETERRRAVWVLWMARGLGVGALALIALGFLFIMEGPGFLVLGFAVGLVALLVGAVVGRRVRKRREGEEESAGGGESTAVVFAGFALGCGALVGALALLSWLLPSHLWPGGYDRQRAQKTVCLSNVKNLALALQMYLADNDDAFPAAEVWCDPLVEYTNSEERLQCPEARDLRCGYAYNRALSGARRRDLADPATTVAIFESDVGWNAAGDASILPLAPRHLEGDTYGLADGRGLWVKREDLSLGQAEIGWSAEGDG
jgi:hypothetical protein